MGSVRICPDGGAYSKQYSTIAYAGAYPGGLMRRALEPSRGEQETCLVTSGRRVLEGEDKCLHLCFPVIN